MVRSAAVVLWNLTLTLLICEAGLRLYLTFTDPPTWLLLEPDHIRYRLHPDRPLFGTFPNSLGFFDEEFGEKRSGVTRVVALCDSYCVGLVPYGENYLTLVDDALGDSVEIFNLGVVHMAVRQYLEILRRDGLRLEPDLVLLGIYIGNDIQPDPPGPPLTRRELLTFTVAERIRNVFWNGAPGEIQRALEGMLELGPDGARVELPPMTTEKYHEREHKHLRRIFRPPRSRKTEKAWHDTERALIELVELCRGRGIPVVATLAPDEIQVSNKLLESVITAHDIDPASIDLDYPSRRLHTLLDSLDVPVLDLTDALRRADAVAPTYHLRGAHWNRRGHATVAQALTPWLDSKLPR